TGSKVLVDSSKLPTYLHTLSLIPSIDLHIVHLIRDPRAVAYSWQKANKLQPDGGSDKETMRRLSPARTSALWVTWNLAGDMLWRKGSAPYLRMRYEQFMEQPRTHTEALLKFLDEDRSLSAFTSEREICMTPDHTVAGNPNRFMTGNVELRPDDAWRPRIKKWHKWTVTGLTWPLLKRYGIL
ncbi:MAG: sulfotransferase, partial [Acidobacteriota bacterium]|nr:sulfotransferase [Acidobacteriota bacterium]